MTAEDQPLADILADPLPDRHRQTPVESETRAMLRRMRNGRCPGGLASELPCRSIEPPYREAYDFAVAISWRTPSHNLCCSSTTQGEVPVTKDELGRALRIFWKQSRAEACKHRRAHVLCGKFLRALAALREEQRAVIRRLVAMQTPAAE